MNLKKVRNVNQDVKECLVLGGIDTLYAFIDTNLLSSDSKELYHNLWLSVLDGSFERDCYTFLNFSGKKSGFVGGWYSHKKDSIPLFRIGFKDDTKQKNICNIYIQLEASGIYSMGFLELIEYIKIELSNLLDDDITNNHILPSRVDLNAFVGGYDFSSINADNFKMTFNQNLDIKSDVLEYDGEEDLKTFHYSSRKRLETLYLGSKSSPLYFKLYDKNLELSSPCVTISSMVKKYFLLSHGFNMEEVWNLEFTIKRQVLKEFGVTVLDDLLIVADSLFKHLMTKNAVFLGYDLDKIDSHRKSKNLHRLPMHEIWQYIIDNYSFCNYDVDIVRTRVAYKKGSRLSALDSITKHLKQQLELEQPISKSELLYIHNKVSKEVFYGI